MAAGNYHSHALRADGSISSWGSDGYGQVANTPVGTGYIALAAGLTHGLALRTDGSIESWGSDTAGQVSSTPSGTGYLAIAAGRVHSLALRADGSIISWGYDYQGQVSGTPSGSGFIAVAAGEWASLALRSDGSLESWGGGADPSGQVSNTPTSTGFTAIAAGNGHSIALRPDGSIESWGSDEGGGLVSPPTGVGFTRIEAGGSHSLGLRNFDAPRAFCFGDVNGVACPCGTTAGAREGCVNSTGTGGAILLGSGSSHFSNDTFRLDISGAPGNSLGLILRGSQQVNSGLGFPAGDGLLCVAGQLARSQVQETANGTTTFTDFQGLPFGQSSHGTGNPTNYQYWYRDTASTCSGARFNYSNAWTETWVP